MFKVDNKNTRTTSMTFLSVSVVDFEQVNVSWVPAKFAALLNFLKMHGLSFYFYLSLCDAKNQL